MLLTLADSNTGVPLDLSVPGVNLVMFFGEPGKPVKATILLFPGPVPEQGQCLLDWPPGALDTVGSYVGEVQVTDPTGRIQTTVVQLKFSVRAELA